MPELREIGLDPAVQGVPVKKKPSVLRNRVVQKCTKYMISKKSNLPHGAFGIKIHVVGCFDPLRPSGLSTASSCVS